jgi:hypothetical protein
MGAEASASDLSPQGPDGAASLRTKNGATMHVSHHPLRLEQTTPLSPAESQEATVVPPTQPLFQESIEQNSAEFNRAIVDSIAELIRAGFPVYLEGLGILTSTIETQTRTYVVGSELRSRTEESVVLGFEKSREITAYHREQFPRLIDTKDLTPAVHAALPPEIGVRLSVREVRRRITSLARAIRESLTQRGFSDALAPLGELYALHNRQGESANDRFAGADIFMNSRFSPRLKVSEAHRRERPILENGWELCAAAYGTPLEKLELNLARELKSLGYTLSAADEAKFLTTRTIPVAVFQTGVVDGRPNLLYVTEGVRRLARSEGRPSGNELTFQLSVAYPEERGGKLAIPEWPTRALTLGWLLVLSSRSRTIKAGTGFAAEVPLIPDCDTELSAIFSTPYRPIRSPQLDREGEFTFVNLVGITAAEADLTHRAGGEHLLTLLNHRGLDQVTKPTRSSITARSVVEPTRNT